jgi:leucyl-tRNA synthetase
VSEADILALRKTVHRTVAAVGTDIEGLRFNRAVAQIYELANALAKVLPTIAAAPSPGALAALREGIERLVQLVAPMMPHLAETCWAALGNEGLVADALWPEVDPALLVEDKVTVAVQVNGKLRATLDLDRGAERASIEQLVLSLEPVARMLEGRPPKKLIVVPDRIVNVVI